MSQEYVEGRIKEALKQSKGNPTKARQKVIAWTVEDPKLLLALARPHLTGIVAHAINRVIYRKSEEQQPVPESPEVLDMEPETFGKEILSALQSDNTPRFGLEHNAPSAKRVKASKSHIEAMRQIARKGDGDSTQH